MKRVPMMLQLALILFCVMAIPTAILTWYSGAQILRNSQTAIAESSLAGLNANRKLNENALGNLAQDTVRLAATDVFNPIRGFSTFEELNANYNNVSRALAVLYELSNLNRRVDGAYSSFFYLDGSNYVISTDSGISKLDRYEPIDWMRQALEGRRGIGGVWYPRKLPSGLPVVSYVLQLNRLTTTTRGTIVVNIRESQIEQYLHSTEPGERGYLLLNRDGTVISHNDKSLLLSDGGQLPFIRSILDSESKEGYAFHELNGERLIYAWSRSDQYGWLNVGLYSLDELMTESNTLQRQIILLTAVIILAGTVAAVFLATWLSRPVRQLVRTVRSRSGLDVKNKNELVFLDAAFKRMQEEEEGLYRLLKEREKDTRSLAVHRLLQGEVPERIEELFPEACYRVAVISIDQYRKYTGKTNPETRSYHRYLLVAKCESLFPEAFRTRCVYQGEGCVAVVMNFGPGELEREPAGVRQALEAIGKEAAELTGHTVTIGVSGLTDDPGRVADRLAEAMEAIKHRMIQGNGGIIFWNEEISRSRKYIDPANSERRILNFLDAGDLDGIFKELEIIRGKIRSAEYVSYDNILFIYNQLVGVTIKHLRENRIHTGRIFAGKGNVYSALTSMDTLDELEEYLREWFREIVRRLGRQAGETSYSERIVRHLEAHYREDIVFEDMAKEIGISYSYMRKIVYELTGKSLIDYLNQLRIEKAKQLLASTELTITEIAAEVGYPNVRNFTRFFHKFEGMPPSRYKASQFRVQ